MGRSKKKSRTSEISDNISYKLVNQCLQCAGCISGREYVRHYLKTKSSNKTWIGKGVRCDRH